MKGAGPEDGGGVHARVLGQGQERVQERAQGLALLVVWGRALVLALSELQLGEARQA